MNPRLKIPGSSRTANQVGLSSCQVFTRAPIQATRPATNPPRMTRPPAIPSPTRDQTNASPRRPTMSDPAMTNAWLAMASATAAMPMMAPAATAIRLPMKSLVTVGLDMSSPFGFCRFAREVGVVDRWSERDDDGASSVSPGDVTDRLGSPGQWVGAVDDRRHLPGFDQTLERDQVVVVLRLDGRARLLAHEHRDEHRPDGAAELAVDVSAAVRDERPERI